MKIFYMSYECKWCIRMIDILRAENHLKNITLIDAKENGFALIDRRSRKGAENMNIGFLHPNSTHGILIELCSK